MTLPTNYADGQTLHGSDVNSWTTAINAATNSGAGPANVVSGSTQTLSTAYGCWVFTGTTSTWTLPAVSSTPVGFQLQIESRGSGAITLVPNGTDHIWLSSA